MRRALMLLALLVAGIAAGGAPGSAWGTTPAVDSAAATGDTAAERRAAPAGIAAAHGLDPSPFLAAPSAPLPVLPKDDGRADPRPPGIGADRSGHRTSHSATHSAPLAGLRAASVSRGAEFRRRSAPLALTRSGLLTSSPTTAPPSFPV